MVPGMLDPEMIEDTAKIINEALNDRYRVSLIINHRTGGNAPLMAGRSPTGSFTKATKTVLRFSIIKPF
jgi:hypothetical protein